MSKERLVVIGNGMAGARLAADVLSRGGGSRFDMAIFGDEPCGNYNRILLSSVLSRSHKPEDIFINPLSWYAAKNITLHAGTQVEQIDLRAKRVIATGGVSERYDKLVIATGSSAMIPPLANARDEQGVLKPGVFVFRTLDDCERIMRSATTARRAAVIGGGLLGLEAARGLLNWGLETHVIHLMPHLMDAQLDAGAADVLRRQFDQMGLVTHLATRTTGVLGTGHVTGLAFADGDPLECDLVVIAAGIRPNTKLAVDAGLKVNRGIVVGDDLACSLADSPAPDVFAVGECAEHRGRVYGLVAPLWEQTARLADRLSGRNPDAVYLGSSVSTKLKVMGVDLAVMGEKEPIGDDDEVVSYSEPSRGIYKKLIVRNDRLVGAIVLGDGAVVPSLLQTFASGLPLSESRADVIFVPPAAPVLRGSDAAAATSDSARICDCNSVSKAQIIEAVLSGARSVQAVCDLTRACTGCGSCRPEVEAIVALACKGIERTIAAEDFSTVVTAPPAAAEQDFSPAATPDITLNKIERFKREKDGLDVEADIQRFASDGWESIGDSDRERLKWLGVFFRRQTPGRFMMRIRMPNGFTNAEQLSVIADLSRECGTGFVDITTRQQIQLRGFGMSDLAHIWDRLHAVDLVSLQTGMDNIRNVIGCPVAGLTDDELFDASPVVRQFNEAFLRNKAFTNLPRKLNVAITGCTENCTHGETQDLSLTPAIKIIDGGEVKGFNIAVGGKVGSGGLRPATPLGVFCRLEDAASLCSHITLIFRDYGPRKARNRARLAFLVEDWGIDRFRSELERRVGGRLLQQGRDARTTRHQDHLGISRQKQPGLCAVGLNVPVGRITSEQLSGLARVARRYGTGDVRITTSQNVIVTNVPERMLPEMTSEPLLRELKHDPSDMMRGVVSCTGIDYCHMALIETKELALKTALELDSRLGKGKTLLTMHWSGCPAGCGNHTGADIGLLGKNVKIGDEIIDAVDVFKSGTKILDDVPCSDLSRVLEQVLPYVTNKRGARNPKKDVFVSVAANP
ncbi:MAG TPA: FAD-dependent oxidoreductase [Vicinamibacterales bacterium]|nr:FAD-dependent oxidoreductase [Vicinamibacterales bacterium]